VHAQAQFNAAFHVQKNGTRSVRSPSRYRATRMGCAGIGLTLELPLDHLALFRGDIVN